MTEIFLIANTNNVVYQFHGCFYHGCPDCFHPYDYNPTVTEKYCNLYSRTKKFTYCLEAAGYKVVGKWECDFLKENIFSNDEIMKMKRKFYSLTPLEPRDVLCGGHTLPACLFKEVKENKKKILPHYTFSSKKYKIPYRSSANIY